MEEEPGAWEMPASRAQGKTQTRTSVDAAPPPLDAVVRADSGQSALLGVESRDLGLTAGRHRHSLHLSD